MSRRTLLATASLALCLVVVAGFTLAMVRRPPDQPIPFDHRLHLEEVGLGCVDCHLYVETAARATIPNVDLCADCHQEPMTDSPGEALLLAYVEEDKAIPWHQVYWVRPDVYFSHRRHVAIAGIECATCHGEVATRERPLTRPLKPVTMKACMDCHRRTSTTNDCITCHV
jgi:hypothetical protein